MPGSSVAARLAALFGALAGPRQLQAMERPRVLPGLQYSAASRAATDEPGIPFAFSPLCSSCGTRGKRVRLAADGHRAQPQIQFCGCGQAARSLDAAHRQI